VPPRWAVAAAASGNPWRSRCTAGRVGPGRPNHSRNLLVDIPWRWVTLCPEKKWRLNIKFGGTPFSDKPKLYQI
jgi:hypothetical protein